MTCYTDMTMRDEGRGMRDEGREMRRENGLIPHPLSLIPAIRLISDGAALIGLHLAPHGPAPDDWVRDDAAAPFAETKEQLAAYFAGRLTEFELPLAARGTPFQQRVWEELRSIAYGATLSYGELARRVGSPNGARAVGLANGQNPIAIIVPCHRVIGAKGKLVGYGGGLPRKEALLALEAAVLAG